MSGWKFDEGIEYLENTFVDVGTVRIVYDISRIGIFRIESNIIIHLEKIS